MSAKSELKHPACRQQKDAAVLAEEGKVTAVEAGARFKLPASAQVLDCKGKFIVAGFWNSHVHFETGWQNAAEQPADKLEAHMQEMLTRWGGLRLETARDILPAILSIGAGGGTRT